APGRGEGERPEDPVHLPEGTQLSGASAAASSWWMGLRSITQFLCQFRVSISHLLCFRYSLTDEGLALAERLESVEKETRNLPGKDGSEGDGLEDEKEEGVVDLTESGQLRAPAGRELVLDYIIERKRMDDLCGSIIDGRFREQKNRTLICRSRELEGDVTSDEEERGIPSRSLISFAEFNHGAVKNKVISSRWCSQEGTMEVKSVLFFENAQILCLFPLCLQCQTVREVFARQLMQISGLSGDKAAAILGQYSTPYR
ncbi:hypothetical protein XENOCAPTIV_005463, partial [Xenoophorus captivus]